MGEDTVLNPFKPGSLWRGMEAGDVVFWVVLDLPIENRGLESYYQLVKIGEWSPAWFKASQVRTMDYLGIWTPGPASAFLLPPELLELLGVSR